MDEYLRYTPCTHLATQHLQFRAANISRHAFHRMGRIDRSSRLFAVNLLLKFGQ